MTILTILKIITRSWWRNKVFFFISIVSLAIGLACTNLLFTYYVHDYNIESGNRDKNRIFCLRQDNPMQDGKKNMQKWKTTCVSILWFHNIVNMEGRFTTI